MWQRPEAHAGDCKTSLIAVLSDLRKHLTNCREFLWKKIRMAGVPSPRAPN